MGQKVNPIGIRLGITSDWTAKWYADSKHYADYLNADIAIRKFIMERLKGASVSRVDIERLAGKARLKIHSARPGVIIGKKGGEVEELRDEMSRRMGVPVHLTIEEIRKPEMDARLVAESVAQQLERRVMFRRAMKRAVQGTMRHGAQGMKIALSGRLAGAEIARREWYREGRVPLHTFRAKIDYGTAVANTTYGVINVKVWIFKGEVHKQSKSEKTVETEKVEG